MVSVSSSVWVKALASAGPTFEFVLFQTGLVLGIGFELGMALRLNFRM